MERILIVGATSAIAAEVAGLHAARGDQLFLVGRSPDKLATLLERFGDRITGSATLDFSLPESASEAARHVADWLRPWGGVDRILIAHGDLTDQLASERSVEVALRSLQINLLSAVALIVELSSALERQGSGRLAVITSVAGERGRPRNYTYGAAKGALTLYLQGLRSRLYGSEISVTTIKLGPVDTPMTTEHAKNALFTDRHAAARAIVRAMDRRRGEVFVPGFWRWIMLGVRNLPEFLFQRFGFLSGR
ncbi:MAG TPA: SDR family NAD(P)-dependent oxidoreductase [Polyangiaceae bacterium]|nr:SDR family NAD(P)-dependent oxidoreductase [Polyangiaceae bacterium]